MESFDNKIAINSSQEPKNTPGYNGQTLLSILQSCQHLLNELGDEYSDEQERILQLKDRLFKVRLNLAVLGQFKRGKSTLLNALLGEEILPTAVIPLTSVPTFLYWGESTLIKVIFIDGHTEEFFPKNVNDTNLYLAQYVTEEKNPKNHRGVLRVEIYHPSQLLRNGLTLIDTPGIGSTLQHNTEATLNFLPQCDGTLFLLSADPPITKAEIEFLKSVITKAAHITFVMNKADYLNEQERGVIIDFFQKVLREEAQYNGEPIIFTVSARQGLQAKIEQNDNLWINSGMASLENYLANFTEKERVNVLNNAVRMKAVDILQDTLLRIQLTRRSLTLPIEDLERRLVIFRQKLEEVERQQQQAQVILRGDKERLMDILDEECIKTIRYTREKLYQIVENSLNTEGDIGTIYKSVSDQLAVSIIDLFEESLSRIRQLIDRNTNSILKNHEEKIKSLADIIRQTAAQLFDIPYTGKRDFEVSQIKHEPYWVTENWNVTMSPLPRGLLEKLLPRRIALKRIKNWLKEDIEAIVTRNVGNLQWETKQNINDAFYRFSLQMDKELKQLADVTRRAIEEAHNQRINKTANITDEFNRLKAFEIRIEEIQKVLE